MKKWAGETGPFRIVSGQLVAHGTWAKVPRSYRPRRCQPERFEDELELELLDEFDERFEEELELELLDEFEELLPATIIAPSQLEEARRSGASL